MEGMIKLGDLFSLDTLEQMEAMGYVRRQSHPSGALWIYNYTHSAQYDRVWNEVTKQCRGLIVDAYNGDVVARPFPKFFNYGEHEQPVAYDLATHKKVYPESDTHHALDLNAIVSVTDKLDGSLGILYEHNGTYQIATRGSFTSEQAVRGTRMLSEKIGDGWRPVDGLTYLFEIIYPENRIVVNYGGLSELVLLEVLDTDTGFPADVGGWLWPGAVRPEMSYLTLAEALAAEPRKNVEGVVVRYEDGTRVKIKQEDYVALHRLVTGMSERTIWEHLATGEPLSFLMEQVPEEFWPWMDDVRIGLQFQADQIYYEAREAHADIITSISLSGNRDWSRKDYAEHATAAGFEHIRPYLFLMLDGRDVRPAIWRTLRPSNPRGMIALSEDTA